MNRGALINLARRAMLKNFFLKFIAIILALSLYIWVSEDRETVVAGYAPVQFVVPDGLSLVSEPIDRAKITFRGRWSDINRFDPSHLDPIRIDLSPTDKDSVVSITSDRLAVPPTIRVTDIEPSSIYVDLERETFKTVPVRPRVSGDPRESYTVEDISTSPATVTLRGPESRLEEMDSVSTERVDVSNRTESLERPVRLDISDGLVNAELDGPVELSVIIATEEITETLAEIPVEAVNTAYQTTVEPDDAELTVRGPKSVIEDLNLDLIRAEIDLSDESGPGTLSRSAEVVNLHPDVELVRIYPERFRVVAEAVAADDEEDDEADEEETDSL